MVYLHEHIYTHINDERRLKMRKIISAAMVVMMTLSLLMVPTATARADIQLKNPVISKDSSMKAGQSVIYDCVYFGSYPQAEVVPNKAAATTIDSAIRNGDDYIVDATLYQKLQNATWVNNETIIGKEKFRRINSENAEYVSGNDYRYFKYQPIKWRVLQVTGNEAFLLADMALDNQQYHEENMSITWENCSLRSFLNENFYESAFDEKEQGAIQKVSVENKNNLWNDTEGGNNTYDKIFLLSESEVYMDSAKIYGFISGYVVDDEARRCKSSSYAKAMGCKSLSYVDEENGLGYAGGCCWWLRSPGFDTYSAVIVTSDGYVNTEYGHIVDDCDKGVRPALKLNLSTYSPTYVGTLGTKYELKSQKITTAKIKTYKAKDLLLKKETFSLKAKTNGDGDLSYKVTKGSAKYITVSKAGKVTLKKGCPKGNYQVTITATGTSKYKKATKKVTIKVE